MSLLREASEETLHLVLETLAVVVKCDPGGRVVVQVRVRGCGFCVRLWHPCTHSLDGGGRLCVVPGVLTGWWDFLALTL